MIDTGTSASATVPARALYHHLHFERSPASSLHAAIIREAVRQAGRFAGNQKFSLASLKFRNQKDRRDVQKVHSSMAGVMTTAERATTVKTMSSVAHLPKIIWNGDARRLPSRSYLSRR